MKNRILNFWLIFCLITSFTTVNGQNLNTGISSATYAPSDFYGYPLDGTFTLSWRKSRATIGIEAYSVRIVVTLAPEVGYTGAVFPVPTGWEIVQSSAVNVVFTNSIDWYSDDLVIATIPVKAEAPRSSADATVGAQIINWGGEWLDTNPVDNDVATSVTVADNSLPVKLTSFKAAELEGQAHTSWTTTEEVNFDHFEILRSLDGKSNFTTVGKVSAKGVNGKGSSYGFTDQDAPKGQMLYYRLKMVDLDGSFELSQIERLELSGVTASVYPNPASSFVKVSSNEGIRSLELINLAGQGLNKTRFGGDRKVETLELRNAPSGVYQVKIEGVSGASVFRKLIVGE